MSSKLPADTAPGIQTVVERLQRESQTVGHRKFDRAPFAAEVPENGFVIAQISGTVYIYTKIGTALFRVATVPA